MSNQNKTSELLKAVMKGDLMAVRHAIAQGESVDSLDRDGRTPLFQAVGDGKMEIVSELIAKGADVNAKDKSLETPLHFAAREYRIAIGEILLRQGAQVDAQSVHGKTPLWEAVYWFSGRGDMIRMLISHGADKNIKNKHGVSPASLSETIANYDAASFLG